MTPDLITLRRSLWPVGERLLPRVRWVGKGYPQEFAGVLEDVSLSEARAIVQQPERVYPCNAAKLKYVETGSGRVFEYGSYAHRPEGFRGELQTHVRLFPHERGWALMCHEETNPWHGPVGHYGNADGAWDPAAGVENARQLYDIDESAQFVNITTRQT